MVRAISASRFPLLDDGKQELVVKNRNNLDGTGSGMKEQADKLAMENAAKPDGERENRRANGQDGRPSPAHGRLRVPGDSLDAQHTR